jgi:hypothetical protein
MIDVTGVVKRSVRPIACGSAPVRSRHRP